MAQRRRRYIIAALTAYSRPDNGLMGGKRSRLANRARILGIGLRMAWPDYEQKNMGQKYPAATFSCGTEKRGDHIFLSYIFL
jgi:hypothetical protein